MSPHSALKHFQKLMTSFTCVMAWVVALLLIPIMLFVWALETKRTRINRFRSYGWSWKKIAAIYKVSPTTVRRWSIKSSQIKQFRLLFAGILRELKIGNKKAKAGNRCYHRSGRQDSNLRPSVPKALNNHSRVLFLQAMTNYLRGIY